MKFGSKFDYELGLVVVEKRGFWGMPSRKSPVSYHWGNELQPLIHADDIAYQDATYEVDLLYDPRILAGTNAENAIGFLAAQNDFDIVLEYPFAGSFYDYDTFNVRLAGVKNYRDYGIIEFFTIVLYCKNVPFIDDLVPALASDGPGKVTFGKKEGPVTSFFHFDLELQEINGLHGVSDLESFPEDVFTSVADKYARAKRKIRTEFVINKTNPNPVLQESSKDLAIKELLKFKSFLKLPGEKYVFESDHPLLNLNFYCTEGFSVNEKNGGSLLEFTLIMDMI